MGNNTTQSNDKQQVMLTINHPKFRVATLQKNNEISIKQAADEKQYEKWVQKLKQSKIRSDFLLLPNHQKFDKNGFCGWGKGGHLKIYYENYSYLLTDEIYNRRGKKQKFEEKELWFLLYSLCAAQNIMKKTNNSKVGDIRPQNVFINTKGLIKVSNLLSWPAQVTNYTKCFRRQRTYLSPEQIIKLEKAIYEQNLCDYQSEVFSIGLTILSAATFQDYSHLYGIDKHYTFDYEGFDKILQNWKINSSYSQIFTSLVSNLCSVQQEKRMTDEQLWLWIYQYGQYIVQKQNFFIEAAPKKVQKELQEMRKFLGGQKYVKSVPFVEKSHQIPRQLPPPEVVSSIYRVDQNPRVSITNNESPKKMLLTQNRAESPVTRLSIKHNQSPKRVININSGSDFSQKVAFTNGTAISHNESPKKMLLTQNRVDSSQKVVFNQTQLQSPIIQTNNAQRQTIRNGSVHFSNQPHENKKLYITTSNVHRVNLENDYGKQTQSIEQGTVVNKKGINE